MTLSANPHRHDNTPISHVSRWDKSRVATLMAEAPEELQAAATDLQDVCEFSVRDLSKVWWWVLSIDGEVLCARNLPNHDTMPTTFTEENSWPMAAAM